MASIGPSFFILDVIMVTVIAAQIPTQTNSYQVTTEFNNQNSSMNDTNPKSNFTSETPSTTTTTNSTADITSRPTGNTLGINDTSTITPWTTQKVNESPKASTPAGALTTPMSTSQSTKSTTKAKENTKDKNTKSEKANDSIGIIILVVIIIVALGFGVACYLARRRGRRYSVDFTSRPDDTNIPLSTIEPDFPVDTVPQNGLQTFESTETNEKEPQEPETKPLVQEEHKAEADKSAVDPSAESAAPAPSADSSEDKPKEDAVEQSPPAPVEPNMEEKTDDEGVVSNKTSVESLKETNENNSNNADVTQKKDWKVTDIFWDVSLDSPV